MSRRKSSTPEIQKESSGSITFQLSPGGIVGIGVVLFCLFFWIFLLGIWAGQTILHPPRQQPAAASAGGRSASNAAAPAFSKNPVADVEILRPEEKKKRIAPLRPQTVKETQ
jgi:hypothetical protein